jgi:hypothetical protein
MTLRYDAYSTEAGYKEDLFLTIVGLQEKGEIMERSGGEVYVI